MAANQQVNDGAETGKAKLYYTCLFGIHDISVLSS